MSFKFNYRTLLWALLADAVLWLAFKVFFPGFLDDDAIVYLLISSFILWAWDCRKKK